MTKRRRVTDRLPLSAIVSPGNLDDRLASVRERMDGHWLLDDERWEAHRDFHTEQNKALAEYKVAANGWEPNFAELRLNTLTRSEFVSEHKALDAKLHGEIQAARGEIAALAATLATVDARVDVNAGDIRTANTEAIARRGVLSDTKNAVAFIGLSFGIVASVLLILDRLPK